MGISKEILDVVLILLPGIIAFIIAETLTPHNKSEFNRSIVYVIVLSAMSFFISVTIWKLYYQLSTKLKFAFQTSDINLSDTLFSFHSSYSFSFIVFSIAILLGLFFAWAVNKNLIYKFMFLHGDSNITSKMEVWDDFFSKKRENSYLVIRDIKNNLMYYGDLEHYSIGTTNQKFALHLCDVDVYENNSAKKLYNIDELYLPFHPESMTVEFPNFQIKHEGKDNEWQ